MDLRKAFDKFSHGRIDKLPAYGIKDIEMKWCTSYLFAPAIGPHSALQARTGVNGPYILSITRK